MHMNEISQGLSETKRFSSRLEGDLLLIQNLEIGSEYILEEFGQSLQMRQAVVFDCQKSFDSDLQNMYVLCSAMNERFSGCKNYIDKWGVLVTSADVLGQSVEISFIEVVLGQVEFISQAMLGLITTLRMEHRLITEEEIDSALDVPLLQ